MSMGNSKLEIRNSKDLVPQLRNEFVSRRTFLNLGSNFEFQPSEARQTAHLFFASNGQILNFRTV